LALPWAALFAAVSIALVDQAPHHHGRFSLKNHAPADKFTHVARFTVGAQSVSNKRRDNPRTVATTLHPATTGFTLPLLISFWKPTMYKTLFSASLAIATMVAMAACGGGSDSACGEKSQSFGITFEAKSFNIKLGEPAELKSILTPESCRADMSFSEKGELPTGMTFVNGNIVGTPKAAGTFQFEVFVNGINGYQPIISLTGLPAIRSGLITVTVPPSIKPAL
jgi:hypothetical protein